MADTALKFPEGYYVFDKSGMIKVLDDFPNQVREAHKLGGETSFPGIKDIYYFGMGGSAIAGDLLRSLLYSSPIPVTVIRDYELPKHVSDKSLLIFSSYSGNTEETLSCYKHAVRSFKNILSISSGGKLEEMAKMNRTQHILIKKGLQPRNALAYQFFPLLKVLEKSGIVAAMFEEVSDLIKSLDMIKISKMGVELSGKLKDKIPLIYASDRFSPVAYRWKTQLNENAKIMAFSHCFPELNHNELMGYTLVKGDFYCIILKNDEDHRRIMKRMELTKQVIKKAGVEVTEIALKGKTLTKMFTTILIGDYTSYYLGLRYKLDPAPVRLVEHFKKEMGPFI